MNKNKAMHHRLSMEDIKIQNIGMEDTEQNDTGPHTVTPTEPFLPSLL